MFLIGTALDWLKPKPDVTLTPQLAPERIIERLGPGGDVTTLPYGTPVQLAPQRMIEKLGVPAPDENGWAREEWAAPYMAAVAHVVFRPRVALPFQPVGEISEHTMGLAPLIHAHLELPAPGGEAPVTSPQTDLGVKPELSEWFKENRILVIAVIVALVLLFFFLKKGRR